MVKIDREFFFGKVRESLFNGRLSQTQVNNLEILLNEAEKRKWSDKRWIAYVLATAYHEVGTPLVPVREGFAKTDAGAIEAVTRLFNQGRISVNYALPDPKTGQSYFGRGYVQLTWKDNYETMGKILGLPLVDQPGLALEPDVACAIIYEGMDRGSFTKGKHKLSTHFNSEKTDPVNARRIVNGTDKAEIIAQHYNKFFEALDIQEIPSIIVPVDKSLEERITRLEQTLRQIKKVLEENGL